MKGNQRIINTREEYEKAMEELDRREFYAEMSDDYSMTRREMEKIAKERHEINTQAEEKNLL